VEPRNAKHDYQVVHVTVSHLLVDGDKVVRPADDIRRTRHKIKIQRMDAQLDRKVEIMDEFDEIERRGS
jgi:hypothetical protein